MFDEVMRYIAWAILGMMLAAVVLSSGCAPRDEAGRYVMENLYRPNGWQLTGWQATKSKVTAYRVDDLVVTIIKEDVEILPEAMGLAKAEAVAMLREAGFRAREESRFTIRWGAVTMREVESWDEFNEWHQSTSRLGVVVAWRF